MRMRTLRRRGVSFLFQLRSGQAQLTVVLPSVAHCWYVLSLEIQLEAMEAGPCTGRQVTIPERPSQTVHGSGKASPHVAGSKEMGFAPILSAWCHKQPPKGHLGFLGKLWLGPR